MSIGTYPLIPGLEEICSGIEFAANERGLKVLKCLFFPCEDTVLDLVRRDLLLLRLICKTNLL